jgi:hypothetical protein
VVPVRADAYLGLILIHPFVAPPEDCLMAATTGYEFTTEQNKLIGDLAGKMRFVGLLAVLLGVVFILLTLLSIAAVYRDQIPAEWKTKTNEYLEKVPENLRAQAQKYTLDKLPTNDHLWGIALALGSSGLFYLLMGIWTNSAAGSFRKIVTTQGSDVQHLMSGLGSLQQMYSLLYMLLVLVLLGGLAALALTVYKFYAP